MAGKSTIEWTDATWNPVRGCSRVSPGCGGPGPHGGCYAEAIAARFSGPGQAYAGLAEMRGGKPRWTGKLSFGHDLNAPLRWRRPRRIFVNSMSDLFHEALPDAVLDQVFAVMAMAPHHTFQALTKRSARMRAYCTDPRTPGRIARVLIDEVLIGKRWDLDPETWPVRSIGNVDYPADVTIAWPLPNVWKGVSVEDQQRADERIPDLVSTPAAVRFVSGEPFLSPIDFTQIEVGDGHMNALTPHRWEDEVAQWRDTSPDWEAEFLDWFDLGAMPAPGPMHPALDWIIVGKESGPNARLIDDDPVRAIRDQCGAAGTAFFYKQGAVLGRKIPTPELDGVRWTQMPGEGRALARAADTL